MTSHPVTKTVREIGKINLTSAGYSLIPWAWYEHVTITKKNRHGAEVKYPDLLGLNILSYIVFWYTPTIATNEKTHQTDHPRRKFKADKLQCGYQELAGRFHVSKEQVKQAIRRLKESGLITVELRTITIANGTLYNVMFVEPVPTNISAITNQSVNRPDTKGSIDTSVEGQLTHTYTYASTDASTNLGEEKTSSPAGGKALPKTNGKKKETDPSRDQIPTKKDIQYQMMRTIGEVCQMDVKLNNGQIGKRAKELLGAGYTAAQVERAYSGDSCWWYKHDWRGQKGQAPKPGQIHETIKAATATGKHTGPTSNGGHIPSS